jgi:hemerythrin-like domain-containing protein
MYSTKSAIAVIRDEHRSIAAVLRGLIKHMDEVTAGSMPPDWPMFMARFDYLEVVPERIHHPKEEEFLFPLLRRRTAESHGIFDLLSRQHAESAAMLTRMRGRLDEFRRDGNVATFAQELRVYADFHWDHMGKEDSIVLPLADRYLKPEDWKLIDHAFAGALAD